MRKEKMGTEYDYQNECDNIDEFKMEERVEDLISSMDHNYEELKLKLNPVFHDKTKHVNGKLLKDCFKYIGNIINSHQVLRQHYKDTSNAENTSPCIKSANNEVEDE